MSVLSIENPLLTVFNLTYGGDRCRFAVADPLGPRGKAAKRVRTGEVGSSAVEDDFLTTSAAISAFS
jgi:hypothetical protein